MARDYKQYNFDATYSGGSFASQACGPTSCADLLEISPLQTADWLTQHGYAVTGHGTDWFGIAPCLTAFGGGGDMLNGVSLLGQRVSPVFDLWKDRIQHGQMGILLMGAGKSSYWTTSGHFIAIVKYSGGKYLVYDPASVYRTGWHEWSEFAGDIKVCYTSTLTWGANEEDTVVSEIYKTARIEKNFSDKPVYRYVGRDNLTVYEAPSDKAPVHSYWPKLMKGNGVKVYCTFTTGYALCEISAGKGTGTIGFVDAHHLSKTKI